MQVMYSINKDWAYLKPVYFIGGVSNLASHLEIDKKIAGFSQMREIIN